MNENMEFDKLFFQLSQEAYIIRSCICTGLTELRNSNINEKGRYYTAFFQLSIALERLAKLALIIDYMLSNNLAAPGKNTVKQYGHDISQLYVCVEQIAVARNYGIANQNSSSEFKNRILDFLSNFAKSTRYANLDALASGKQIRLPIFEWSEILREIIEKEVSGRKRKKIMDQSTALAEVMEKTSYVVGHDLQNNPLSMQGILSQPRLLSEGAKYAVWYMLLLIAPLTKLICYLATDATELSIKKNGSVATIPEMSDFFGIFWNERTLVLRKKKWP